MSLSIRLLGGLGAIGRNCMAIEDRGEILIVDAGLYFPELRALGVDIAVPDFSVLEGLADRVVGVVLTHGHEDHIGALGHLLAVTPVPVAASRLTLALASKRLEEAGIEAETIAVADYESVRLGRFSVQFLPVAHSVPESNALLIETSEGAVYHTGDFKLDPSPLDGRTTDLSVLADRGAKGELALLMIDSTNAEEPGRTESELAVRPALTEAFAAAGGRRVIATCFASHIHRVTQLIEEARRHGRKIAPVGRSMQRVVELSRGLGLLDLDDDDMVPLNELHLMRPADVCILSTGSQGEPRAALSLMAKGQHKHITLTEHDVILMSSDAIPGNESDVGRLIDSLVRAGAEVVHAGQKKVHVSGHAKRDELREVIEVSRAKAVLPVHGEYRHLASMVKLVESLPGHRPHSLIAEDGDIIEYAGGRLRKAGTFPAPYIYLSNSSDDEIEGDTLRARRTLQSAGVLTVAVHGPRDPRPRIEVEQFGWLNSSMFDEIAPSIVESLTEALGSFEPGSDSPLELEEFLEARCRRLARKRVRTVPHVIVLIDSGDDDA